MDPFGSDNSMQSDPGFSVADYLQLAGMSRRSVELLIKTDEVAGRIVIRDGLVMVAEDQHGSGVDAFGRMAMLSGAAVECRALDGELEPGASLHGQVDELLLEAARRRDEQQRQYGSQVARRPTRPVAPPTGATAAPPLERPVERTSPGPTLDAKGEDMGQRDSVSVVTPVTVGVTSPPPPPPKAVPRTTRPSGVMRTVSKPVEKPGGATAPTTDSCTEVAVSARDLGIGIGLKGEDVLAVSPTLSASARASADGSVLGVSGKIDAETTCAVVALAARQVEEVVLELGLGDLGAWHIGVGKGNWYVVSHRGEMLVVQGEDTKNPASVLQKIESGCRR